MTLICTDCCQLSPLFVDFARFESKMGDCSVCGSALGCVEVPINEEQPIDAKSVKEAILSALLITGFESGAQQLCGNTRTFTVEQASQEKMLGFVQLAANLGLFDIKEVIKFSQAIFKNEIGLAVLDYEDSEEENDADLS